MSHSSLVRNITTENNKILIQPLTVKTPKQIYVNRNNQIAFKKGSNPGCLNKPDAVTPYQCKEDLIYESALGDFLQGNPQIKVTLLNHLNLKTNSSQTIARYTDVTTGSVIYEETSVKIAKILGQDKYDILFSALCSVINLELKVRGMLTLLSQKPGKEDVPCQTEEKDSEDKCCQTTDSCMELLFRPVQKKRVKRNQLTPYVVTDLPPKSVKRLSVDRVKAREGGTFVDSVRTKKVIRSPVEKQIQDTSHLKKVVIDPLSSEQQIIEDAGHSIKYELTECAESILPELKQCFSEDSNEGSIGNVSMSSLASIPNVLDNTNELLKEIEQRTEENILPSPVKAMQTPTYITMLDGTQIKVPIKPEDHFHIATKEILASITDEEKAKLLWYQAYIDYKCCLEKDEFGYLPLHIAVLNNDVQLLKRQCVMLRYHREQRCGVSIDVTSDCNKTALQLAFYADATECTSMLLQYGADPFFADEEQRTLLHLAAEHPGGHLAAILSYLQNNARQVLQEQDDLWKPDMETMSEGQLAKCLLDQMCKAVDSQGYTPLMVASKTGFAANVKLLIEAAPSTIDMCMPNSGNTALYLAVGAACMDTANRCNKSKIAPNFNEIIKSLINSGADPLILNHSNSGINDLLSEFNISELSHVVNLSVHTAKHGPLDGAKSYDSYMLLTDKDGSPKLTDIKTKSDHAKTKFVSKDGAKPKNVAEKNVTIKTEVVNKDNSQTDTGAYTVKTEKDRNPKPTINKTKSDHSKSKIVSKNGAKPKNVIIKTEVAATVKPKEKPVILENIPKNVVIKTEVIKTVDSQAATVKPKEKPVILENISVVTHDLPKPMTIKPPTFRMLSPKDKLVKNTVILNPTASSSNVTSWSTNKHVIFNKYIRIAPKIENDIDDGADVNTIESASNIIIKNAPKRKVQTLSTKAKKAKGVTEIDSSDSGIVLKTVKHEPMFVNVTMDVQADTTTMAALSE